MRHFLIASALAALTACGGGDVSDDYVRHAERACSGPFSDGFSAACAVELRLAGTEVIEVTISGRVAAANTGTGPMFVSRSLHVQLAGAAAGHTTLQIDLAPGDTAFREFTLHVEVPADNLGGFPPVIGLSSFDQADGGSTVDNVLVSATAR